MESVKSPTLFPKEEKLVYERVWIDAKTKEERHSLWLVTGKRENRKPLEELELDGRSPVVSPDGEWIAFLSTRTNANSIFPRVSPPVPAYSDVGVDVWLYEVKTGKIHDVAGPIGRWGRVFHDGFYGRVAFSPDSKRLVFVADDGKDPRTKDEIENDVEIVRPDQGEGYTGYGPAQVWIAEIEVEEGHAASPTTTSGTAIRNGRPTASRSSSSPTRRRIANRCASASTRTSTYTMIDVATQEADAADDEPGAGRVAAYGRRTATHDCLF